MLDTTLPIHPTKVHPLTGKPLVAVGILPSGRIVWPIMGAAESDEGGDGTGSGGGDGGTGSGEQEVDPPFPPNTAPGDMENDTQRAAYYQHQARKHEDRNKAWKTALGGRLPDDLKADLDELETLRESARTDGEKAIEQAKKDTRAEYGPKSVRTAFELLLGDMPSEERDAQIDLLDLSKFLTESGDIDTDKVRSHADKIAPADKGSGGTQDFGAGHRNTSTSTGVSAGRAAFDERRGGKKSETTTS